MKNVRSAVILTILALGIFGCSEIDGPGNENLTSEYAIGYSEFLSDNFRLFAAHLENYDLKLHDRINAYNAGLTFADNFSGQEKIDFENAYKASFNFTLLRYEDQFHSSNIRTLTEDASSATTVDFTGLGISPDVQEFMASIAKDAYTLPMEEIIALIDNELSSNSEYYQDDTKSLDFLITTRETAKFLLENEQLFGLDEYASGRVKCASLIASTTLFGGMFGAGVGFIAGSFIAPGPGTVAGGWTGQQVGAALGGLLGAGAGLIGGRVWCDEIERKYFNPNDPYNVASSKTLSNLKYSDLIVRNLTIRRANQTFNYNLF